MALIFWILNALSAFVFFGNGNMVMGFITVILIISFFGFTTYQFKKYGMPPYFGEVPLSMQIAKFISILMLVPVIYAAILFF